MTKTNEKDPAKTTETNLPTQQSCPPHKWELPQINPFNTSGSLECPIRCGRCATTATLTIALDKAT
jgi:hypothetical protein